ncbi:MAG: alpha/beta fold hydrolase [Ruaniaceae bacterium]|nr:alpha/beta fold hydrolase [Ruaniaceae bacterium]
MTRRLLALLSALLLLAGCTSAADDAAPPLADADREAVAQQAVEALAGGDPTILRALFSRTLAAQLSESALTDAWEQVGGPAGEYQGTAGVESREEQGYIVVTVTSEFSEMSVAADLTFGEGTTIEGIWFSYAEAEASEHPDPPTLPESAMEVEVAVGQYELPGLLTLPEGDGGGAVVLLVSGSGPNDMDGTFGTAGNAILRDLAYQLAAEGVPTLRYEKRFHAKPELATAATTIQDEVIDDAVAAVRVLSSRPETAGRPIVVLGHSLGGMVLPAVLAESPEAAGGIILASTVRSLWDVVNDQNLAAIAAAVDSGSFTEEQAEQQRATLAAEIARANALTDPDEQAILGSMAAPYVVSLNELRLPEGAAEIEIPLLVLHGDSDFQISPEVDFESWRPVLAGNPDVTFHLFEGLNHFLMPAGPVPDYTDYDTANVVDPAVSAMIAEWLGERW